MSDTAENPDNYIYNFVMFDRQTVAFMVKALNFYLDLLHRESMQLASDADLDFLVSEESRRELGLGRDKDRTERIEQWLEEELEKREGVYNLHLTLSHWIVRVVKSAALLYIAHLKNRRNALADRPNVTRNTLNAVDRELGAKEELFRTAGIFKNASELPLLADQELPSLAQEPHPTTVEQPLSRAVLSRPVLVDPIQILDPELRERCLDIFNRFQESGQSDRNDTVVAEASRILENRLRLAIGADAGQSARQLASSAFNVERPRLRVSMVRAEQEATQFLFFGAFGFIRNQVQHRLLADISPERVMQILGFYDYLLSVINQGNLVANEP